MKKSLDLTSLSEADLSIIESEIERRESLPHLYGFKLYKWQHDFIESRKRDNLLTAANQCGKSVCQIIRCIRHATEQDLWGKLWVRKPNCFWYFYPSLKLATIEFKEKWVKELLPRGKWKNDPIYGWKENLKNDVIQYLTFNTGVTVYFFSYSQRSEDTQAGTVAEIFTDEELPYEYYSEIQARLRATRGQFNMVFTATLGQEVWRRAVEGKGEEETFKGAFKRQVSLYDCQKYIDGSPSQWTSERILEEINRCGNKNEIQRRIYGRFILESSLVYSAFDSSRNTVTKADIPGDWRHFSGVDVGGGGEGHPAAIVFVAVNPDYTKGIVYKCWKGGEQTTTAGDVYDKYVELRDNKKMDGQFYDWASKDFHTISERDDEYFEKADKGREIGSDILNTLFRMGMLSVYADDEGTKLVYELCSFSFHNNKRKINDDLIDALRYAVSKIPWNFKDVKDAANNTLVKKEVVILNPREQAIQDRKFGIIASEDSLLDVVSIEQEIKEANELYGL